MAKWVYTFGAGEAEGGAEDRDRLGGKGANLARCAISACRLPPGLTIVTAACNSYLEKDRCMPEGLREQVREGIARMEKITGRVFGRYEPPAASVGPFRRGAPPCRE